MYPSSIKITRKSDIDENTDIIDAIANDRNTTMQHYQPVVFSRRNPMDDGGWKENDQPTLQQTDSQAFDTWCSIIDQQVEESQGNLRAIEQYLEARDKEARNKQDKITHTMAAHMHLMTSTQQTQRFLSALNLGDLMTLLSATLAMTHVFADSHDTLQKLRTGEHTMTREMPLRILQNCYQRAAVLAGPEWIAKAILHMPTLLLLTDKPHEDMERARKLKI